MGWKLQRISLPLSRSLLHLFTRYTWKLLCVFHSSWIICMVFQPSVAIILEEYLIVTKRSKYAHTPHIDAIILTDYFSSFIYVWEEKYCACVEFYSKTLCYVLASTFSMLVFHNSQPPLLWIHKQRLFKGVSSQKCLPWFPIAGNECIIHFHTFLSTHLFLQPL